MKDKQYYLANRSHYFYGKLMGVRDFEKEQQYMNNKRRLGNRMLHGTGVVCGLNLLLVDNQSFQLEAGLALDYLGREILVPEPCVKRLGVIEGFDEACAGDWYLCIKYDEELCESTFSVADTAGEEQFNSVREGYTLYATQQKPAPNAVYALLFQQQTLYQADGIEIIMETQRYANPNALVPVKIHLTKQGQPAPMRFSVTLGGDLMVGDNGEENAVLQYDESEVRTNQDITLSCMLQCTAQSKVITTLEIREFSIQYGATDCKVSAATPFEITVTENSLQQVVLERFYHLHFEDLVTEQENQTICLAKMHVIANKSSYFIESLVPQAQYLVSTELLHLLNQFPVQAVHNQSTLAAAQTVAEPSAIQAEPPRQWVTGVEHIQLGFSPKQGKCYYSYAFVHGLGYGKICVVTALENNSELLEGTQDLLVFGGNGIFPANEFAHTLPRAEVGALVDPQKGTLQLGVRLLEKTNRQSIDVRWWAMRCQNTPETIDLPTENSKLVITPNTISIEPMEQTRFTAMLSDAACQEINWRVTESGGGTIDGNGLYTAPAREGLYEITAQSVRYEGKTASAFVIVRVKQQQDAE